MHDPDVVAFDIRRPWPRRERGFKPRDEGRWKFRGPFWVIAGLRLYWPTMITVWHREPGGRDSGEVCKHYIRWKGDDGKWQSKMLGGWRWHVHHWRIQISPLQHLRRWALTRCAWCGGRSRKGDSVNISQAWHEKKTPWWRGEPDLFHLDCSAYARAHRTCTCADPLTEHDRWGKCALCGKSVNWGRTKVQTEQARILTAVPQGQRDSAAYQRICDLYAASQASEPA